MMSDSDDELPPMAVPLVAAPHPAPTETAAACATSEGEFFVPPLPPPVPVLLLTGFLGAGKTTLVNYILTERHGYRCAVLLNEFADSADIEKALVREPADGSAASPLNSWVQLENGCICCSVKNDMVQALEALMQQRDRFDYVIIETTGLANPGPVAAALWTDAELECSVCLDAIVTVVDAKNVRRHLQESRPAGAINEAQQQVAFADVVLLNKVDLVEESDLQAVESAITGINAEVEVVRCERCVVDLGRILHTGSYTGGGERQGEERNGEEENGGRNGGISAPHAHGAAEHEDHAHHAEHDHCSADGCTHPAHAHSHDPGIRTVTLHAERPVSLLRVRHWLDELLWEREREGGEAPDIFRAKGLLHVEGSDRKWVLQAVHELYDVVEGPEWGAAGSAPIRSKIIFIGRHLDGARLQRELNACCCSS